MQRLDPVLKELNQELTNAPPEAADDIQAQIKEREENLLPFYTQVAIEFADLHDRSGRMQAKGVIRDTINWRNSRSYFYWRLRRRLAEDALVEKVQKAAVTSAMAEEAGAAFKLKLDGMLSTEGIYGDDRATTEWLEGTGAEKAAEAVKEVATGALQKAIAEMEARLAQL
eukprot:scaffold2107_cov222-Pinguiococcus_pyrenoidosus.AAC.5